MTYQQCIDYFYSRLPMYHRIGAAALKLNLDNIRSLCGELGNPETRFPSVHIAGTNGKGSCSHMLAAVLQSAGYKTGLYTSPHIKEFRERIKIDGKPIPREEVVSFVENNFQLLERVNPSFFELTVALAFRYFASKQVEVAIIEVGLGGRLDSTNILMPLISLITNIGMDHNDLLGNTLALIAREKAGIIKHRVPVVIGERHPEVDPVFIQYAQECHAPIYFAQDHYQAEVVSDTPMVFDIMEQNELKFKALVLQLNGPYQYRNILPTLQVLDLINGMGFPVDSGHLRHGLERVKDLTGIMGRWQTIGERPKIICDTGHNRAALEYTVRALQRLNQRQLHIVIGFVNDKDIRGMLEILPKDAMYYFCSAGVPRSLDAGALSQLANDYGLRGLVVPDPNQALQAAKAAASVDDLIFVGGSTFVVAELNELVNEQA